MNINSIMQKLQPSLNRYINRCADNVAEDAKRKAPVRSGALRDSIKKEPGSIPLELKIVADVPYAIFIEYGTYKMSAQPFLQPALRNRNNYR
jgi:HK97 gp10 family phage protein